MRRDIRIIFAGGGTGGHVFPAIYLAGYLKKYWGADCQFIGTKKGLENKKVPQSGFLMHHIWISGFRRGIYAGNLLFPLKLLISSAQCRKILKATKPDLVIGTGGYVAGPVLRQAAKMNIPTAIQEQNSYPGVTTRLLAPLVDCVFLAYADAAKYLKKVKKMVVCGNPVKENIKVSDAQEARKNFGLKNRQPVLLVFGGSQGARNLNQAVAEILENNGLSDVQLIWQTGRMEFEHYKEKYKDYQTINLSMLPFIDRMDFAYTVSDLAITRAGAMTISELAAAALPAILVPFPQSAADHQSKNARTVEKAGGALLIEDKPGMTLKLLSAVRDLLSGPEKLKQMADSINRLHNGDSMAIISEELRSLIEAHDRQSVNTVKQNV